MAPRQRPPHPVPRASASPVNLGAVRRHNLGLLLRRLRREAPLSRAELAARTGLTKVTVSSLVAELLERGLVGDSGPPSEGRVGRPAQPLTLSGRHVAGLGLEVDVDRIGACVVDLTGQVRSRTLVHVDNRKSKPARVLRRVSRLAADAVEAARALGLAIGGTVLSVPGVVSPPDNRVYIAPNLGWNDVFLGDRLPGAGLPFRVENNANAAALGELSTGATRSEDFVYVALGVGIGAGVISGGKLFRGARGFGAELGHITVLPGGPECRCGNRGCLEALVGLDAVRALAAARVPGFPRGAPEVAMRFLGEAESRGDAAAVEVIDELARWLVVGLAAYANLLDPEAIVIGGYGASLGAPLLTRLERGLSRAVLGARFAPVVVRMTPLADDASLVGAALSALEPFFDDPTLARRRRSGH